MPLPDASLAPEARRDLLVVGVGNPVREDDGVGLVLAQRLAAHFGPSLACLELFQADVGVAEQAAGFEHLLVIDAREGREGKPFELCPLVAAAGLSQPRGFVSHVFDWGQILALARDLFGRAPEAQLLAVSASSFGYSETLSAECAANAEQAFAFLVEHVAVARRAPER